MVHDFKPGDFLIFQLESGYALLRVLAVDENDGEGVWHLTAYQDLFLDPDTAESAIDYPSSLAVEKGHVALTNRAFESTPVARMGNVPLTADELRDYDKWKASGDAGVSDRSIRLILGLR